jgi:hypothetical protein
MPFRLTNCPAAMQCFMNHVFAPLYAKYNQQFKNYMDDCLIATGLGEEDSYHKIMVAVMDTVRDIKFSKL